MIIDAHLHLGTDVVWDATNSEAEILAALDGAGVAAACVLPQNGEPTVAWARAAHDRIAAFARAHPRRIFGLANVHPYNRWEDYAEEVRRAVRELDFRAVKVHPHAHGANPLGRRMREVFELARELEIPVLVHTGVGMPFANPTMWIPLARDFPGVPVVLAHAGQGVLFGEAMVTAETCPNVHLEVSSTAAGHIARAVARFGARRVLFASDNEKILGLEVAKWQSLGLPAADFDQAAWRTAAAVYRLPFV
jgi:predicted TIM-barrel fold metal-dependent hydrolase